MEFIPVNKYLCCIIDQDANVDIDQMITHIPTTRINISLDLKPGLTIMDIIIRWL